MLERLYIKNFALIEELSLELAKNFTVLTGETGAGKSIVIDAVTVLLGGRALTDFIRTGTEKAILEGTFYLEAGHPGAALLADLSIDSEDGLLVLTREISQNGRHTCRVNGRTLPLAQYRQLGLALVDIHGQHDQQLLLRAERHLPVLDRLGGGEVLQQITEVAACYSEWQALKKELETIRAREQERLQRMDFLKYQLAEIEAAKVKPGEMEELTREVTLLANAEKINAFVQAAYQQLFGGERGSSAYDALSKVLTSINEISKLDSHLDKMHQQLEPCLYVFEETAAELREYLDNIEFSPQRLELVEKRLHLIKDLCKKYGPAINEVILYGQKAREELAAWETSVTRAEELEKLVSLHWQAYEKKALKLRVRRQEAAVCLENRVTTELIDLAMPHACFAVKFEEAEPGPLGLDQAEFLISPNPGEPLMPVARIASGGELSRIMLALKTILADLDGIGTLIFDEIDSGIGGKAAQKVAQKLEEISKSQQVVCVTHSPLIAARADHHLLIEKGVELGRTRTMVRYLSKEERVEELARMLGGENQTSDLKKHALKILKQ